MYPQTWWSVEVQQYSIGLQAPMLNVDLRHEIFYVCANNAKQKLFIVMFDRELCPRTTPSYLAALTTSYLDIPTTKNHTQFYRPPCHAYMYH